MGLAGKVGFVQGIDDIVFLRYYFFYPTNHFFIDSAFSSRLSFSTTGGFFDGRLKEYPKFFSAPATVSPLTGTFGSFPISCAISGTVHTVSVHP